MRGLENQLVVLGIDFHGEACHGLGINRNYAILALTGHRTIHHAEGRKPSRAGIDQFAVREKGHVETTRQLQGRAMARLYRQTGHSFWGRFLVGNRADVRCRGGVAQPARPGCPDRVGFGTVSRSARGNHRRRLRHMRLWNTLTRVTCPGRSQVHQNQEVGLSHQPKVVLCQLLVEDPHRIVQCVLSTIATREPAWWHPVHHHRQTVFGSQAVEHLAPAGAEHVVQRRLSLWLLFSRSGCRFFLRSGLPVVSE